MRAKINRENIILFCKKYHWITLLLVITVLVCIVSHMPVAYASDLDELKTRTDNLFTGFSKTNFQYMSEAYISFFAFTTNDTAGVALLRVMITAVGSVLVFVFTIVNILKETQRGEVSMDYWFRIIASMVIAIFLVTSVGTFMDYIYGFGDYVIKMVERTMETDNYGGSGTSTLEEQLHEKIMKDQNGDQKLLEALTHIPGLNGSTNGKGNIKELYNLQELSNDNASFYQIKTAEPIISLLEYVVYAPMLISMFLIFSAVFEVKIRQIFAPAAVAVIAYEGSRSSGVRFLKKYLACFVKIAIYFLIAAIGAQLTVFFMAEILNNGISTTSTGAMDPKSVMNLCMMIGANIVAAMSMMQSSGLGDEIVGV